MSPFVLGEIVVEFVNRLTADGNYPVQDCENFQLPIQMQLSEKRKTFSQFFVLFSKPNSILNIFKKRMILIANAFPKLQTVKILLSPLSKKRCFRTRFDSQHVKASEIFGKSPGEHFCHVFSSFSLNLISKMSPLSVR